MKTLATLIPVFLAVVLVCTSISPYAKAAEPVEDDEVEIDKKLKYPYAGEAWNQKVTMTKLELAIAIQNKMPLTRKDQVLLVRDKKPVAALKSLEGRATPKGLAVTASIDVVRPSKDIFMNCAGRARHVFYRRGLKALAEADQDDWPIAVRVLYKGRVVYTKAWDTDD